MKELEILKLKKIIYLIIFTLLFVSCKSSDIQSKNNDSKSIEQKAPKEISENKEKVFIVLVS